ncbi:PAS domain S-box-containing protein [Sphingomonas sp. PP-CE-3A-406]|uniref:PAS domain S-box protein n=1 Tax=Sphingomonas sp. PP-CE-3A-406 TaxID=2135659 RepID=UPI000F193247|nr:PAS domain S-box protein [Sphingomonas sp. PP-CE-3A-406]RMB54702.1 PAS domain S-box-containing protein [Sphingomonas sp. PP-CE-3A-406]
MNAEVSPAANTLPPQLAFLAGGGEAARLILGRDWTSHPLGPPEGWPDILKSNLSTILNSPESMILAWGEEDLTFFFNDAYFPLLGPRLDWAMGTPFKTVWPDAWEQAKPIIDEAFAGRSQRFVDLPWKLDTDRGRADTWFSFSYSRILDARGAIAGLFVFTNETTERVLADAALRQSEERLRLVIEGAKDHVIFTTDPVGIITTWSAGAEVVLGWSADEAIGQPSAMILADEDDVTGPKLPALGSAARQNSAHDERWHVRRDGSRVFLTGSVHPLPYDAQGKPRGFIKIARDETERRRAEQALRDSEAAALVDAQRVQLALAAGAIIGTWVWDLPSDRFTVDEPFARAFGLDPAMGREGLSLAQIVATVHPDDQAGLAEAINDAIARGGGYAHQYRTRRANGEYHWLEANGRVDHAPDGTPTSFPGVLIDVEERRKVAAERDRALNELRRLNETLEQRVSERTADLMRAEEALRQSQKMEAVGQLTGGLAHDFNNLLTAVTGGLELLALRVAKGEYDKLDRYVAMAQTGASRAAALTQRLLAFSRRQTLAPTPTDADRLIAGMAEIIDRTLGPEIEVKIVSTTGLWPVLVDAPQLENALLNLCINARDAMPHGGRLTIATQNTWLDAQAAADQELHEGDYVALYVTDTGTGMTPETIERVFEPFFTTKPIGEGTGLGLSMIYGFVRQSGGQVRICSEVGRGTIMCLYLPRHDGEAAVADQAPDESGVIRALPGETVLVVEDETAIRDLVTEVLSEAGYRVLQAPTGPAGVKLLRSDERIDLLVTDVGLPGGLNGRQVADAGRAVRPDLKILFVTGYAANAAVGAGHLVEGMEVLTKPFSIADFEKRIRSMIGTD